MLFGQTEQFAIEIGAGEEQPQFHDLYVPFRFWVDQVPLGDWTEQISLSASARAAAHWCDLRPRRQRAPFAPVPPAALFQQVYEAYYSLSCFVGTSGGPDLRTLHHLDPIGMGALRDRFGILLVATQDGQARILARDLAHNRFNADLLLPEGLAETTLSQYAAWASERLQPKPG